MPRLFLKLALMGVLVFTGCVVLIPARGYDASATHALFAPPGCPAPCLLGIRPGQTTLYEALKLLDDHPWVGGATIYRDSGGQARNLTWDWNGRQPTVFADSGVAEIREDIITTITLRTGVPFAEIWLAFGQPLDGSVRPPFHWADYPLFDVATVATCGQFWLARAEVIIEEAASGEVDQAQSRYDLAAIRRGFCEAR